MNRNFAVLARLALWGVRGVRDFRVWGLRGVKASSAFGCERFRDLGFGAMGLSAVKALGFGVLGLWACLGGGGGAWHALILKALSQELLQDSTLNQMPKPDTLNPGT